MLDDHNVAYEQSSYAPEPTKTTLFMRTFIPYQIIRFIVLSIKILLVLIKSKSTPDKSTQDITTNV